MKTTSTVLIASLFAGCAAAEQATDTIRKMDECFALARKADAICNNLSAPASMRLDCLQKTRNVQEECLEQVRAAMEQTPPAFLGDDVPRSTAEPQQRVATPDSRSDMTSGFNPAPKPQSVPSRPIVPPELYLSPDPVAPLLDRASRPEPPSRPSSGLQTPPAPLGGDVPRSTAEPQQRVATPDSRFGTTSGLDPAPKPQGVPSPPPFPPELHRSPDPVAPLLDRASRPEPPSRPSSGWIVGETVSPIDYSPLLVAQLFSVTSSKPDAPSAFVLRCRAQRTEISVRTRGSWHPTRAGDVEIIVTGDGRSAQHFRWPLASDGKSASSVEDAANTVRGLAGASMSVAVTDATGDTGTATFELAGIDRVREKLATTCRWPAPEAQSNRR